MNVDEILFRASSFGKLMTEGRDAITDKQLETIDELQRKMKRTEKQDAELQRLIAKRDNPDTLGATAKTYLRELFRSYKYSREKVITNKYIEHGIKDEEEALTLLAVYKDIFLKKNHTRLTNKFLSGEPDTFVGESIKKAKEGYDTKVCWSIFTLPEKSDGIDSGYYWQDMSYCALTGAEKWTTVYTLVNADPTVINREKERIWYAYGKPQNSDDEWYEEYKRKKIEIEKNMIFDINRFREQYPFYEWDCNPDDWKFDIPMSERIVEFPVLRDDKIILQMYEKAQEARDYMKREFLK